MRHLLSIPSSQKEKRKIPLTEKNSWLFKLNDVNFSKVFTFFIVSIALLLPAVATGEMRQVQAEWGYQSVADLAGFRLYKEGILACETNDPVSRIIDCQVDVTTSKVTFTMTAYDILGNESAHSQTYTVDVPPSGTNLDPTAVIKTSATSVEVGQSVTFDGSGSSDADGLVVAYDWYFMEGSTGIAETVNFTFGNAGTYPVTLTVTDDQGATAQATTTITVTEPPPPVNQPPVAAISFKQLTNEAPSSVAFDGTGSTDPDGKIASYSWNFGDGSTAFTSSPNYTFMAAGIYIVILTVEDNQGLKDQTTTTITVTEPPPPGNIAPSAAITTSASNVEAGQSVTFDGSGSSDPDGKIAIYAWNFDDGSKAFGSKPVHTYTAAGIYSVTLTVTDDQGATAKATKSITVTAPPPPNQSPTAAITASATSVEEGQSVAFNGSGSSDPDGNIVAYAWNFGDGGTASASTPDHRYSAAGTYDVTLTVTDNQGASAKATKRITVSAAAPPPDIDPTVDPLPVVNFGVDQKVGEGGDVTVTVYLDKEASQYPVDVPYTVSGTAINPDDHDAQAGVVRIDSGLEGSMTFYVVADDATGGSGEDDETVVFEIDTIELDTQGQAGAGPKALHTVTITETNIAPVAALKAMQTANDPNNTTRIIVGGLGNVELSANAKDPNPSDNTQLTYNWKVHDQFDVMVDSADNAKPVFTMDPAGLSGLYRITVEVSDSEYTTTSEVVVNVVDIAPDDIKPGIDTDGDGLLDVDEGFADSDNDGIPDYQDAISDKTKLQTRKGVSDRWLLTTESGLNLQLGATAFASGNHEATVTDNDKTLTCGIFDFKIAGLSHPGQAVKIVLPQKEAIPANPVYFKKRPGLGWTNYAINENNRVASAPGELGKCPPAGDSAYTEGLTEGDFCVQLTIEDGGNNDADNKINGIIDDPSGVGQVSSLSVSPSGGSVAASDGGGCTINKGANDPILTVLLILSGAYLFRRKERQAQ